MEEYFGKNVERYARSIWNRLVPFVDESRDPQGFKADALESTFLMLASIRSTSIFTCSLFTLPTYSTLIIRPERFRFLLYRHL